MRLKFSHMKNEIESNWQIERDTLERAHIASLNKQLDEVRRSFEQKGVRFF
jgi:hypothetical protein